MEENKKVITGMSTVLTNGTLSNEIPFGVDASNITYNNEQFNVDWEQSDETAADYIKNRPFYLDEAEKTVFYENNTLEATTYNGHTQYFIGTFSNELDEFYPDGCVYLSVDGSPFYKGVGNNSGVDVGEAVSYSFNNDQYRLSSPYGYYRLYLSGDTINETSGRTHSVIIKTATEADSIKLMDGTLIDGGAAADWEETNTESVNYIHNKPFYVEKFPRTSYAKSTNTFPIDFNWKFPKNSNLAAFMTNGKGLVLAVDGVEYGAGVSTGSTSYPCFEFDDGNFVLKYGYLSSATTSNGYTVYLDYLGSELDKTVAHKVTISTTEQKDIIHQIDKQFIPVDEILAEDRQKDRVVYNWAEDDGNHIAHIYNKPFGHFYYNTTFSGVETFTQLLESTIPNGQWYSMTGHQNYSSTESDWLATLAENDELKQYKWKVTINGVEYLCQWTDARDGFERNGDDSNAIYLFFGEDRKSFFRLGYNATYYYYGLHLELGGKEREIIGDKTITLSYSKYRYERIVQVPDELLPLSLQSDWNENDETALSYVKNRTHYEVVDYILLCEDQDGTYNRVEYNGKNYFVCNGYISELVYKRGEQQYKIVLNNVEKTGTSKEIEPWEDYLYSHVCLGNASLINATTYNDLNTVYDDTGEDYAILWGYADVAGDVIVIISEEAFNLENSETGINLNLQIYNMGTSIQKLDYHFMPFRDEETFAEVFNDLNNPKGARYSHTEGKHAEEYEDYYVSYCGDNAVTRIDEEAREVYFSDERGFRQIWGNLYDGLLFTYNYNTDEYVQLSPVWDDEGEFTYAFHVEGDDPLEDIFYEEQLLDELDLSYLRRVGANGEYSHIEGKDQYIDELGYCAHAEGWSNTVSGSSAHAEGEFNTVSGDHAHVEGEWNKVFGYSSHAEGSSNTIKGDSSHAEGSNNEIHGDYSHIEGRYNIAGSYSHVEGEYNVAFNHAHAEGGYVNSIGYPEDYLIVGEFVITEINDDYKHEYIDLYFDNTLHHSKIGYQGLRVSTETSYGGDAPAAYIKYSNNSYYQIRPANNPSEYPEFNVGDTVYIYAYEAGATGFKSHSEGKGTVTIADSQHVQGRYNEIDKEEKYAHIIGGGYSEDNRYNIHTVDWDGNAVYSGKVTVGTDPVDAMDVVTKQYLENNSSAGGFYIKGRIALDDELASNPSVINDASSDTTILNKALATPGAMVFNIDSEYYNLRFTFEKEEGVME